MEYVSLKSLAEEMSLDRSFMRKYVLRQGLCPVKIRTADSGSQLTLALTKDEAESVREARLAQGYVGGNTPVENARGYFYIIQLVPARIPSWVKLGFACDVAARLQSHRTSAPTAALVTSFPCDRTWEKCAIASITREGCKLVGGEVFDCEDIDLLVYRAHELFALMPGKV